jgi:hypothetical protein
MTSRPLHLVGLAGLVLTGTVLWVGMGERWRRG